MVAEWCKAMPRIVFLFAFILCCCCCCCFFGSFLLFHIVCWCWCLFKNTEEKEDEAETCVGFKLVHYLNYLFPHSTYHCTTHTQKTTPIYPSIYPSCSINNHAAHSILLSPSQSPVYILYVYTPNPAINTNHHFCTCVSKIVMIPTILNSNG